MIIVSKDGSCLASGTVTKKGGELKYVGERKTPNYSFSIQYENKKGEDGKWYSKYLDCEVFGNKVEKSPVVNGGDMVLCAGKLRTSTWTGRDGEERTSQVLQCDFVMVSGNMPQNATQSMAMDDQQGFQEMPDDSSDGDLPF